MNKIAAVESVKRTIRRKWYSQSRGRLIAFCMLLCIVGAAILDTRCPCDEETVIAQNKSHNDEMPVVSQIDKVAFEPIELVTPQPKVAGVSIVSKVVEKVDSSTPYYSTFNEQGMRVDIPPKIIARWAWHESAMKPRAARYEPRLGMWSRGIGQFLESTWREWAAAYGYTWDDAYNPEKNIRVMADYLWWSRSIVAKPGMTEREIVSLMLAGYNAGPHTTASAGLNSVNASVRTKIEDTLQYAGY